MEDVDRTFNRLKRSELDQVNVDMRVFSAKILLNEVEPNFFLKERDEILEKHGWTWKEYTEASNIQINKKWLP